MIKNTQKITQIIMKPFADCLCAIGHDWYHIDFEVTFVPGDYYPDYMTVSKFISKDINGFELNIEDAVITLGDMLKTKYSPKQLTVRAIINQSTTHFPVEVIKEY